MKTPVLILALSALPVALFSCNNDSQQTVTDGNVTANAPVSKADSHAAVSMANCWSCHDPEKDKTGPPLKGALARWDGDRKGIKAFIRNSAQLIAEGDKHAVAVFKKYNNTQMTAFGDIYTDAELDEMIDTYMK